MLQYHLCMNPKCNESLRRSQFSPPLAVSPQVAWSHVKLPLYLQEELRRENASRSVRNWQWERRPLGDCGPGNCQLWIQLSRFSLTITGWQQADRYIQQHCSCQFQPNLTTAVPLRFGCDDFNLIWGMVIKNGGIWGSRIEIKNVVYRRW